MATKADIPGTSSAKLPPAPARVPRKGDFGRAPGGDQIRDLRGNFAGGFAINWIGMGDLLRDVQDITDDIQRELPARAQSLADEIEQWAKDNAPWRDVTGTAREELHAFVVQNRKDEVSVVLAHGVDYGPYLENANGGINAIILPTMEHFAEQVGARLFGPGTR